MLTNSTILVTGGAGFINYYVKHSLASIEKAKNILDFTPQVSFKEGLERTIEFFRG
jgi:nucleoside-diphosphate-sugar epimerase